MDARIEALQYPRSRRPNRRFCYSALFILTTVFLFSYQSESPFPLPPSPLSHATNQHQCPLSPPNPPLVSSALWKAKWNITAEVYPLTALAELPEPNKISTARTAHDTDSASISIDQEQLRKRRETIRSFYQHYTRNSIRSLLSSNGNSFAFEDGTEALFFSLEALWAMGMKADFQQAVTKIAALDFTPRSGKPLELQKLTAALGALISAYELTCCRESRLLDKALQLGEVIYTSFDTPTRSPRSQWTLRREHAGQPQDPEDSKDLAELSAFMPTFTRLSHLTGDMRYYDAVVRCLEILALQQAHLQIPGLWASHLHTSAAITNAQVSGQNHTFTPNNPIYTSLTRLALLLLPRTPSFTSHQTAHLASNSLNAAIQRLLFRPITPLNTSLLMPTTASLTRTNTISRTHVIEPEFCTLAGTLSSFASLYSNSTMMEYASLVGKGCIWASTHSPSSQSLMLARFTMLACTSSALANQDEDCSFDAKVWPAQTYPGFETVGDAGVSVGTGVSLVSSLAALWRGTGQEMWRENAWDIYEAIVGVLERSHRGDTAKDTEINTIMKTLGILYSMFQ